MNLHPQLDLPGIDQQTTLFWFRRDLRIEDNAGLYHALKENQNVLPIFIFDSDILDQLDDKTDRRVEFIHRSLHNLKTQLEHLGSSLLTYYGRPLEFFEKINPKVVYTNHDYEPYGRQRDEAVATLLEAKGVLLKTFKDQVIFEKNEVTKENGDPYTVFTPYSRKWKSSITSFFVKGYSLKQYVNNLKRTSSLHFPSLRDIGFLATGTLFSELNVKTTIIKNYDKQRNFPGIAGTSRLSVHLRFGTVSIRSLTRLALKTNETWLNELIWRDFYHMILWQFPHVATRAFKPAYDRINWRNNVEEFNAWCGGRTGYPIVDAGMRELNATGFMHNRVRMIVASFLVKHLLIDWRWGEAYFAKKLLDYDLAANNGGWQWAAGSGCDAAPYFRIFNPELQAKKFDAEMKYVNKWVPEVGSSSYAKPIVDHAVARARALKSFAIALEK